MCRDDRCVAQVALGVSFVGLHTVRLFFFFFQAEDGIRDVAVTGVQTCALPISFSISLSWILRCFLISAGVWNCAGRPVSSWRKRTSWRRAAETGLSVVPPSDLPDSSVARSPDPS